MAAELMGVITGGNMQRRIGTTAERADIDTVAKQVTLFGLALGAGSKYWDTDLKAGFVWSHGSWQPLV
jgi:hypothetical protein